MSTSSAFFRNKKLLFCGSLFFISIAIYIPSLGNGFLAWDDPSLITENEWVRQPSISSVTHAFTSYDPELYTPLTTLSYIAESALLGLEPWHFHLVNVLLHALNAVLVFLVIFSFTRNQFLAFATGLLFALHPIQSQAILWVSARKDILACLFFLTMLLSYLRFTEAKNRKWFWWSVFAFVCALGSKITVVFAPLVLLLIDYKEQGTITRKNILSKWPFFLLSLLFLIIGIAGKPENVTAYSPLSFLGLFLKSIVFAISQILVPIRLSFFHEQVGSVSFPMLLLLAALLCVIVASVYLLRQKRTLVFGAILFLLLYLPSLGGFSKRGLTFFFADHWVYTASIGLFLIVAWIASEIYRTSPYRWFRAMFILIAGAILLPLGLRTMQQISTFSSTESLYRGVLISYPDSYIAHLNLGTELERKGELDAAILEYERAIEIQPDHPLAHANLGAALGKKGDYNRGMEELLKSLELDPSKVEELKALRKKLGQ